MRIIILFLCCFVFTLSNAQQPTLRFFEAALTTPVNYRSEPNLVGKIGSHFMVMDNALLKTKIYLFDSSFQLAKQTEQLDVVYAAKKHIIGDKVKIVWNEHHTGDEWLCLLILDENGDKVDFRKYEYSNPDRLRLKITSDIQNRYYLFSFIGLDDSLHAVINGVLLDSSWNKIKTFACPFEYNAALERGTVPVVDAAGNIHVFVYDKLSNYRLSARVTVNTIPLDESSIRKQSFQLNKAKLYDPYFFDDPQRRQITLQDFYYDGATKNKEGLAVIDFPYERNEAIRRKLTPMPDSVLNGLYKKTKNLKKRQNILESIITTNVFGNQGTSLFQTELLDLPAHQLVRDAEVEPEERKNKRSVYRNINSPYDDGIQPNSGIAPGTNVERWLEDSRVMNTTLAPGSQRNAVNTNNSTILNRLPSFSSNIGAPPVTPVSSPSESPFANMEMPTGPEKKVVFFVNDAGLFKWYRYLPPGFPSFNFSNVTPGTYPMKFNNEWQFLHLDQSAIVSRNDKAIRMQYNTFSVTHVNDNGLAYSQESFKNEIGTRFFKPILLKNGEYVMAYMNGETGRSGLAVLSIKN